MDPCDGAKENAVLRHRKIDSRRGQHRLREKSKSRKGDAGGDQCAAARTQKSTHDGRRRRRRLGKMLRSEHAQISEIHRDIDRNHTQDAEDQAARQSALRIANFAAQKARRLPAAIGEKDRRHGGAKGEQEIHRRGAIEQTVATQSATGHRAKS